METNNYINVINNDSIRVELTRHRISTTNIYIIIQIYSKIFVTFFFFLNVFYVRTSV